MRDLLHDSGGHGDNHLVRLVVAELLDEEGVSLGVGVRRLRFGRRGRADINDGFDVGSALGDGVGQIGDGVFLVLATGHAEMGGEGTQFVTGQRVEERAMVERIDVGGDFGDLRLACFNGSTHNVFVLVVIDV